MTTTTANPPPASPGDAEVRLGTTVPDLAMNLPEDVMPRAQIKDEKRYQAMRREGMAKDKAARIANTDPQQAGRRGGQARPYEEWTRQALYERAKDLDIPGRSTMTKAELIRALRG